MSIRLEHKMYTKRIEESTFDMLYELVLDKGFSTDNCLTGAIHGHKLGQPMDELACNVFDFLVDAGFEVIYTSETPSLRKTSIRFRGEYRATSHLQVLIKADYHQIKPYVEAWNNRSTYYGKEKLFHVRPIEDNLKTSLWYLFKNHFDENGYIINPYGEFLPFYDETFSLGEKPLSIEDFHRKIEEKRVEQLELDFPEELAASLEQKIRIVQWCVLISLFATWFIHMMFFQRALYDLLIRALRVRCIVFCVKAIIGNQTVQFGIYYPNAPPLQEYKCNF